MSKWVLIFLEPILKSQKAKNNIPRPNDETVLPQNVVDADLSLDSIDPFLRSDKQPVNDLPKSSNETEKVTKHSDKCDIQSMKTSKD